LVENKEIIENAYKLICGTHPILSLAKSPLLHMKYTKENVPSDCHGDVTIYR